jgi:hypothetical protein
VLTMDTSDLYEELISDFIHHLLIGSQFRQVDVN